MTLDESQHLPVNLDGYKRGGVSSKVTISDEVAGTSS